MGQLLFCIALFTLFNHLLLSKAEPLPNFAFAWLDGRDEFRAGDIATIQVKILGNYRFGHYRNAFNPNISVDDKMGNSAYITGLHSNLGRDKNWRISFIPIMVGLHNVLIADANFKVFDSSLHFHVSPGPLYPPGGIASWMSQVHNLVAGTKATILILPKDAFWNNITSASEGKKIDDFVMYTTKEDDPKEVPLNVSNRGWDGSGYIRIEFIAERAGSILVHVKQKNDTLIGSPLRLKVDPGALDVGNCMATWSTKINAFQIFSTMETYVHQRDKYGNLVPGMHAFDFDVMEKGTNLSLPIGDLQYTDKWPGIQLISFKLVEAGDFILMISDVDTKKPILNMPHQFTIYIGYCDEWTTIVNGSTLVSVAGEVSKFFIYVRDAYEYPSPLELEWIQVEIKLPHTSFLMHPQIHPMDSVDGTQSTGMLNYGAFGSAGIASLPSLYSYNNSAANWNTRSSAFEVVYVLEKVGVYDIYISCGNIPLKAGQPTRKVVIAGEVNDTESGIVHYDTIEEVLNVYSVIVRLVDSFSNPIIDQGDKFNLLYASMNRSTITDLPIRDNLDGTYAVRCLLMEVGTYELCVMFFATRFMPCPFGVTAHSREYFPRAFFDSVSVWEDESISISVLDNDNIMTRNARVFGYEKPGHGSVLQYGNLLRYTPFKGFYGSDSFMYTVLDVHGNKASAPVEISVHCSPPRFVSSPSLQANEDLLSPKFGGFPGLEIAYSDLLENISVTLSAQHGTVFISPLQMQLWDPMWDELSVNDMEGRPEDLKLAGHVEVINFALRSLQYIGDENFNGMDAIRVTTTTKYGKNDLDIPIFVEPINDPPFINVPEFIILEDEGEVNGFMIFDRERDKFNFSVGDPDLRHFPGNETHFQVLFSVEVNSGFFSANLPAALTRSTELKLKSSKQWQPLLTFVEISGYFTVKAKGIRFRGTINDCNTVLQQLRYYGDNHGGVLRVKINDMGWYGCYPDCVETMSVALTAEAAIILITRSPVNSLVAHSLGSVIVTELILLSSLAVILMFFTCKCVIVLLREKKKRHAQSQNIQLSKLQSSDGQASSTDSSENMTNLTGTSPSPVAEIGLPSNPLQQESGLD